jgi:hypothetical protein
MSFNFTAYPTGPTALSPASKDLKIGAVKLTFADFTTGGAAAIKAVLPKDASIVEVCTWVKTAFSGNGVTAIALAIGVTGTAAKYATAINPTLVAGTFTTAPLLTNIMQEDGVETGDQSLLFTGTATTGNPTAGELIVLIRYVR